MSTCSRSPVSCSSEALALEESASPHRVSPFCTCSDVVRGDEMVCVDGDVVRGDDGLCRRQYSEDLGGGCSLWTV